MKDASYVNKLKVQELKAKDDLKLYTEKAGNAKADLHMYDDKGGNNADLLRAEVAETEADFHLKDKELKVNDSVELQRKAEKPKPICICTKKRSKQK